MLFIGGNVYVILPYIKLQKKLQLSTFCVLDTMAGIVHLCGAGIVLIIASYDIIVSHLSSSGCTQRGRTEMRCCRQQFLRSSGPTLLAPFCH